MDDINICSFAVTMCNNIDKTFEMFENRYNRELSNTILALSFTEWGYITTQFNAEKAQLNVAK